MNRVPKSVVSDATHHASLFLNIKKLNFIFVFTTPRSLVALFCDVKLFSPQEETNKVGNRDDMSHVIWIIVNATEYNF